MKASLGMQTQVVDEIVTMRMNLNDEEIRAEFSRVAQPLEGEPIEVTARALASMEAIGIPPRDDFALSRGNEKIIEANFKGFKGHAFSAAEVAFTGKLREIIHLPLKHIPERAIFFASLNAVLASQRKINRTVHCRDKDPMLCGEKLADYLAAMRPQPKSVALIGYQPGMTKSLSSFCRENAIRFEVTDMNPSNIGKAMFGITIRDGDENEDLIRQVDQIFCTGSTIVNGTIGNFLDWCEEYTTRVVFFWVTIQGPATLMGWDTFCPFGRNPHDKAL
jgi:uncharacterized protein (DUF4213/DUF364 family)